MIFLSSVTPTPIPLDNLPEPFGTYVNQTFKMIIAGLKGWQIPFTHVTMWQFIIFCIALAAAKKALNLMYGKGGESTKHE